MSKRKRATIAACSHGCMCERETRRGAVTGQRMQETRGSCVRALRRMRVAFRVSSYCVLEQSMPLVARSDAGGHHAPSCSIRL